MIDFKPLALSQKSQFETILQTGGERGCEYRFAKVPIVLQMRAQLFDAQEWNNHIYIYENDVLYAYAIPFVYGKALRCWLNARYKINDTFSLYLRVSETIYQNAWAVEHNKNCTRADVHALLRVKL